MMEKEVRETKNNNKSRTCDVGGKGEVELWLELWLLLSVGSKGGAGRV